MDIKPCTTGMTHQKDVDQEVGIAATLEEDTDGWQDDGEAGRGKQSEWAVPRTPQSWDTNMICGVEKQ